jgi:hypothetical protein
MDFARLSLFIVGTNPSTIILPIEKDMGEWRSGLDAIALLCKGISGLFAGLIILDENAAAPLAFLSNREEPCP